MPCSHDFMNLVSPPASVSIPDMAASHRASRSGASSGGDLSSRYFFSASACLLGAGSGPMRDTGDEPIYGIPGRVRDRGLI